MTSRTIRKITQAPTSRHGTGLLTRDVTEEVMGADMDPFIVVSLYEMAGPTFPPHPHAGFSVATYILPESPIGFINQDSIGHRNIISPGSLHVTLAGSGVLHEEQPERPGSLAIGFQIWIDHANGARASKPSAISLDRANVPVQVKDGATIRAVLGTSNEVQSPLTLPTAIRIIDVGLEPHATFIQALEVSENAFLIMIAGSGLANGHEVQAGEVVRTAADGRSLQVTGGNEGARFTLFAGEPFQQARAQRGPMVASDERELRQFMTAYSQGKMGTIIPFSQQSSAT